MSLKSKLFFFPLIVLLAVILVYIHVQRVARQTAPPELGPDQSSFTDDEILNVAYKDYILPPGFYNESLGIKGAIYYENTSGTVSVNGTVDRWSELCADSIDQARNWSELSSNNSSYYRDIVEESESDKFYQFKRVYSKDAYDILLSRVHKCEYLDLMELDRLNEGSLLGRFNKRPVNEESVKELAEYIWFVENYNSNDKLFFKKILSSFAYDNDDAVKHDIYEISIHFSYAWKCDEIPLVRYTYAVDKDSGEISLSRELIRTVKGKCH